MRGMVSVLVYAVSLGLISVFQSSRSPAWAIPGEKHYVGSEFALVREEPHGAAAVVAKILEGQVVIEIARQQNWLEIGVVRQGVTGWVHLSFLVAGKQDHRRSKPLISPMRKFRPAFDTFNTTKGAGVGEPPFTSISDRGNGVLLVSATVGWWSKPRARKEDDLASLYQMWKVANEQLPVSVFISDLTGQRQLMRRDKGAPSIQP